MRQPLAGAAVVSCFLLSNSFLALLPLLFEATATNRDGDPIYHLFFSHLSMPFSSTVEQLLLFKEKVAGSNPAGATNVVW